MELALALTCFGVILTLGTFAQNYLLTKQTDRHISEGRKETDRMIQAEDARAKEIIVETRNMVAETRNMVAETKNVVVETRNMVAKMDERTAKMDERTAKMDERTAKIDERMARSEEERRRADTERRAHEKFMEELMVRIHEKVR